MPVWNGQWCVCVIHGCWDSDCRKVHEARLTYSTTANMPGTMALREWLRHKVKLVQNAKNRCTRIFVADLGGQGTIPPSSWGWSCSHVECSFFLVKPNLRLGSRANKNHQVPSDNLPKQNPQLFDLKKMLLCANFHDFPLLQACLLCLVQRHTWKDILLWKTQLVRHVLCVGFQFVAFKAFHMDSRLISDSPVYPLYFFHSFLNRKFIFQVFDKLFFPVKNFECL